MRHALTIAFALTVIAHPTYAESSESFEAALVRPSGPDSVFQSTLTPSQFVSTRHTLAMLIASSYPDLPSRRMSGGPSWVTKDTQDFVAKLPPGTPTDQERLYRSTEQMLRIFLAQEFKLKTHFVQREHPVYDLVPAKGGPKIRPSETAERSFRFTAGGVEIRH